MCIPLCLSAALYARCASLCWLGRWAAVGLRPWYSNPDSRTLPHEPPVQHIEFFSFKFSLIALSWQFSETKWIYLTRLNRSYHKCRSDSVMV